MTDSKWDKDTVAMLERAVQETNLIAGFGFAMHCVYVLVLIAVFSVMILVSIGSRFGMIGFVIGISILLVWAFRSLSRKYVAYKNYQLLMRYNEEHGIDSI